MRMTDDLTWDMCNYENDGWLNVGPVYDYEHVWMTDDLLWDLYIIMSMLEWRVT